MNPSSANRRRALIIGLVIIALIIAGYALRSHFQHGHGHEPAHDHGAAALALNDGQRWATDEPLRLGMQRIRDAVALQLPAGNLPALPPAQAKALAHTVEENVTYLIQNCRLEPAADANLHVIINDLMAGTSLLTADGQSAEGLAKLHYA
ncbi:MAG: hypothetical protein KA257_13315, partial [Opitutaceae bacterium]|nr:hypothetical protein [Opitutaceae bacterium]